MAGGHLVAFAALHPGAVPIQVVQLQLHVLHLRMLRQHPIQQLRPIVVGKADMPHQTRFFLFPDELPAAQAVEGGKGLGVDVV